MFFMMGITDGRKQLDFTQMVICGVCGKYGRYQVFMTYTVLSLFFIPCFKWNRHYYVQMSCCNTLYELDPEMGSVLAEKLEGTLPALSLNMNIGLNTAFLNDVDGLLILAQEVQGYGNPGDVFLGISTSGNSVNVNYAAIVARAKGMKTIALTGKDGGKLKDKVDVAIVVNEMETFKIQELHLPVYHALCLMLEERFF